MLKIRLKRMGNRNRPFYRIVVSDSRLAPTSSAIEELGYYDPTKGAEATKVETDRIEHWVSKGAKMSSTVSRLLQKSTQPAA